MIFTGCDDSEDGVPGKGSWYKSEFKYPKEAEKQATVTVYWYYSDSAYSAKDLTSNAKENMKEGLTVLIRATGEKEVVNQIADELDFDKSYVCLNFAKGASLADASEASSSKDDSSSSIFDSFKVTDTGWTALYAALVLKNKANESSGTPAWLTTDTNFKAFSAEEIKGKLTWKTVLIALLES